MARKSIDYSLQLNDIAAPTESRAGSLYAAAGAVDGQANKMAGENLAQGILFAGGTAAAAYKGKQEAELVSEIDDATSRLEGYGDVALRSQANLANVQDDIASFADNAPAEPEHIAAFGNDISRFINAQRQGVLSRGEVINRIGAAVKKHSAMMPGSASDFRKIAAEKTGIANAEVYGLHEALTKQSAGEKAAAKAAEAEQAAIADIAKKQGVLPSQVTREMLAYHHANTQLNVAAQRATDQMSMVRHTRDEADRAWGQIYTMQVGEVATGMAQDFARMASLASDPSKTADASAFGLEFAGKVAMTTATMERNIAEMSRPQPGRTPLSMEASTKMLTEWRALAKNWQEAAKEIEGRNFLGSAVKSANQNVELLLTNFKIANPHLTVLNSYGSVSELVKAWFAIGNKEEFNKRFSPALGAALERVMQAPAYHAGVMGSVFGGQGVNLPQVAQIAPELAQVVASDMVSSVRQWAKEPATPQRKEVFANTFAAFYSDSNNFVPSVPRNIESAYTTLSTPEVQQFFGGLSSDQRTKALLPLVGNIERAQYDVGQQIHAELLKWNTSPDNTLAQQQGRALTLERNRLTGAVEIVETQGKPLAPPKTPVSDGFSYTPRNYTPRSEGVESASAREGRARAQGLVTNLNRMLETYTLAVRSLGLEGASVTLPVVQERAFEGLMGGKVVPLTPGLVGPQAEAAPAKPDGLPEGFNPQQFEKAIVAAERSGDTAVSPKGAVGRHQFMEATAKDFGLKVDLKAGVDERKDPVKSGTAAVAYGTKLAKMFKGDMEKVAASYNAGEGTVQAAVKKATDLGMPDQWKGVLASMGKGYEKETIPYIKRFMDAYKSQPIRMANASQ